MRIITKKSMITSLIIISITSACFIQTVEASSNYWVNSYAGQKSPYAWSTLYPLKKDYKNFYPHTALQARDGSFVIGGELETNGGNTSRSVTLYDSPFNMDAMFFRINSDGSIQNASSIHGETALYGPKHYGRIWGIVEVNDGFIVAGGNAIDYNDNYHGYGNIWVVKIGKNNKIIWNKGFGIKGFYEKSNNPNDPTPPIGEANVIAKTPDNGVIIAGHALLRLNANGGIVWSKINSFGRVNTIKPTSDNGCVLMVTGDYSDLSHNRIVKIDGKGNIIRNFSYSIEGRSVDFKSIEVVSSPSGADEGYIMFGDINYFFGTAPELRSDIDWLLVRIDLEGNIVWEKNLNGHTVIGDETETSVDFCSDIIKTSDGNFVAGGTSNSFNANGIGDSFSRLEPTVVKINKYGDILWQRAYSKSTPEGINMFATLDGFGFTTDLSTLDPHYDGYRGALLAQFDQEGFEGDGSSSTTKLAGREVSFQIGLPIGIIEDMSSEKLFTDVTIKTTDIKSTLRTLTGNMVPYQY